MKIKDLVSNAVIEASTTWSEDLFQAYRRALDVENNENASWLLELLVENAQIARKNKIPLCDDTGIPHVIIEIGDGVSLPGNFFVDIKEGIKKGLRELPARPMAVRGNHIEKIEQSKGLYDDPGKVVPPNFIVDRYDENGVDINVLMLGGGPEIRANIFRVFHRRDNRKIFEELITWMRSEIPMLGCTPCIPTVGIGRTHFEASSLMLKAMAHGNLNQQSNLEKRLTKSLNESEIGALGMGGSVTALGTLVNIGPQRASGVRILCMRPCCCVEPRNSLVHIPSDCLG